MIKCPFLRRLFIEPVYEGSDRQLKAKQWETDFLERCSNADGMGAERINYLLEFSNQKLEEAQSDKDRMEKRLTGLLTFCGAAITLIFTGLRLRLFLSTKNEAVELDLQTEWSYGDFGLISFVFAAVVLVSAIRGIPSTSTLSVSRLLDQALDWAQNREDVELLSAATTHKAVESLRHSTEWLHQRHAIAVCFVLAGLILLAIETISY